MIIAIDGPAGAGKSTTARLVAQRLGFLYLDTGAMYRAVALAFLRAGYDSTPEAAAALLPAVRIDVEHRDGELRVGLNGEDVTDELRRPEVGRMASRVAALPAVREKLVAEQRRIGHDRTAGAGVVIDGRDIGTVVFPDADLKIFMVADQEVRARRRLAELRERGVDVSLEDVLQEMEERDRQDRERAHGPLRKAVDAVELDTSGRTIEDQVQVILDLVGERRENTTV